MTELGQIAQAGLQSLLYTGLLEIKWPHPKDQVNTFWSGEKKVSTTTKAKMPYNSRRSY